MGKYVICDLEMCKVPKAMRGKAYKYAQETIQIGAVMVNENMEIEGEFLRYIKPQYGAVDGFIKKLTGITSFDLKDADDFETVLGEFTDWIGDATVVSWSNSDELQIRHEMDAKHVINPEMSRILETWVDCQVTFGEKVGDHKQYNLTNALLMTDLNYKDEIHDGLVDAYNTALLFIKMETEPVFQFNSYFTEIREEKNESFGYCLGDLFAGLNLGCA